MSSKDFDLIVFGATSFTGKLVVEYLDNNYKDNISWALAGRNKEKLEVVKEQLSCDAPILIIDSESQNDIQNALSKTKLVITTVGPYQLYGNLLIEMCAKLGVDYVDLCGEPGWMYEMQKFIPETKKSGSRIVHSCGYDSIPSDLGVFYTQNLAQEKFGVSLKEIKCRVVSLKGEFSGGTLASLKATMSKLKTNPDLFQVLINPFALCEGFKGADQPHGNKPYFDEITKEWVAPFFMAPINTKNVHRSNLMLNFPYGEEFIYEEMIPAGKGDGGEKVAKAIASHNPLGNAPKPGEGPSKEVRDAGYYEMLFLGLKDNEIKLKVSVKGQGDPGYSSTSKMITESALCLLNDCSDLEGGIYTTAPAFGFKLIKRLQQNNVMHFSCVN